MLGNNYTNPKVNLDIDFSVSKGGYRLRPHRDDITRLYNFLIYLTNIPKKNGGSLTIDENKKGLARELARMNLTLNTYTQWYWKTDLLNLLNFLSLRADSHAQ